MSKQQTEAVMAPSGRERRGRLLFMGESPPPESLVNRLRQTPIHVQNLFEAIGEVTRAEAGHPVVAALICTHSTPDEADRAAEAIRRVDPSVRVIGVADPNVPQAPIAGDHLDGRLEAPIDPESLSRLLGDGIVIPAAFVEEPVGRQLDAQPDAEQSPPVDLETREMSPQVQVIFDEWSPPVPPVPPAPQTHPEPVEDVEDKPTEIDDLGDTDLIDAVMRDPQGVRQAALALIRQQTGFDDIQLIGPDETPGDEGEKACVRITHGGRNYGTLTTAIALTKQIEPWAQWLAKWLALDSSYREYRVLTYRDDLTGAWNRRYFNRFLAEVIDVAGRRRRPLTVMVFDIDDFKRYNDVYGHEAGDVILRETVALMNSVIRKSDRVCRIGGDEFAVIFADIDEPREEGSRHPECVEQIARRFQKQVCEMRFPKLGLEAPGSLSISAGLASYPWDGIDADSLLRLADQRAMESKRRGKNHITYGPKATEGCPGQDHC